MEGFSNLWAPFTVTWKLDGDEVSNFVIYSQLQIFNHVYSIT